MSTLSNVYSERFAPWEQMSKVAKAKRVDSKCKHEIFRQCAKLETNTYWKKIFTNASRGKFLPGYAYKEGILTCKVGNKMKELNLPEDPELAILYCKEFFNKNTGVIAPEEREKEQKDARRRVREARTIKDLQWSEIRKNMQTRFFDEYANEMCQQEGLPPEEADDLYSFIQYQLFLKNITSKGIHFEDGKIKRIEGIQYDHTEKQWKCTTKTKRVKPRNSRTTAKRRDYWFQVKSHTELDAQFMKIIDQIFKSKLSSGKFIPMSSPSSSIPV